MIHDLVSQDSDSDSESGEEVLISWEAPHNGNTGHHLHGQPKVGKCQAIRDDGVELTAAQRENIGYLNDDASETRDSVNEVLNEINNAGNIGSEINDNGGKQGEFSGINRSLLHFVHVINNSLVVRLKIMNRKVSCFK